MPIVHIHGFGISGSYLEPTAALLASRHSCFVRDLPGMGLSRRPELRLAIPGLARSIIAYCNAVGVERACFVGNSLGCPLIVELAARRTSSNSTRNPWRRHPPLRRRLLLRQR